MFRPLNSLRNYNKVYNKRLNINYNGFMHLTNIGGFTLLILLAILAPSPIPIPLDGIVIGLIASGFDPTLVLVVAGIGDVIGTIFIYLIGRKGRDFFAKYHKRRNRSDYIIAEDLLTQHGRYALLLSGVPFLGDALIFLAGFFRLKPKTFFFWFTLGKIIWYSLILGPIAFTIRSNTYHLFMRTHHL